MPDQEKAGRSIAPWIFLGGLTLLLVVMALIVATIHTSSHKHVVPTAIGGGPTARTRFIGVNNHTYYGATILFRIPSFIKHLQRASASVLDDQLVFDFNGGKGALSSQGLDPALGLPELKKMIRGPKRPFKIAGGRGFMVLQGHGSAHGSSVIATAIADTQRLTIQLTATGDSNLTRLTKELARRISLRLSK